MRVYRDVLEWNQGDKGGEVGGEEDRRGVVEYETTR